MVTGSGGSWLAGDRAKLVLAILRRETTIEAAAHQHDLTLTQIADWTSTFLDGGEQALGLQTRSRFSGRVGPQSTAVAAGLVLVSWLALRMAFWNGYYTEDSPGYVSEAIQIAVHGVTLNPHVNGPRTRPWPYRLPYSGNRSSC